MPETKRILPWLLVFQVVLSACNTGDGSGAVAGVGIGTGTGAGVGVTVRSEGPAAPGTPNAAEINCMNEIGWRSGGSARLISVMPMDSGMTYVKAAGLRGVSWKCFANPDGQVATVMRDGGFGWF
ncbi:MAG: hypothetical protein JNK88_11385 [Mangrovicoccus sp.]|nr:hypothetical protein [Mangrovicoccus sp.]